jgi:hypothetical protein
MRLTRYGEPSSREIDALRQPPYCPVCGDDAPEYGDTCEIHDMTTTEHLQLIKAKCQELLAIWGNKRDHNPIYTATEGKRAEAGWRSTIAAIDGLEEMDDESHLYQFMESNILAAWPIELLQ